METANSPAASKVLWIPCDIDDKVCNLKGHYSYQGFITVPLSYNPLGLSSENISVYVQKFFLGDENSIDTHVIFLAGGPGYYGRTYDPAMKDLMGKFPNSACYTIDHRGLGRSTPLPQYTYIDDLFEMVKKIPSEGTFPFEIKYLTMSWAANDVEMLAGGIRLDENWKVGSKLVLYGASYGAQLAHHVVQLFPNTYDYALMEGTPDMKGLNVRRSHLGVVEHCESHPECRRLFGQDVKASMEKAIKNVTNKNYNECTKKFWFGHEKAIHGKTQGEMTIALINIMSKLITDRSELSHGRDLNTAQLAFAMIKATSDCKEPSTYKDTILKPLKESEAKSEEPTTSLLDHETCNSTVNIVMKADPSPYGLSSDISSRLGEHFDLAPSIRHAAEFYENWKQLSPYLDAKNVIEEEPINTTKTKLFFLHGQMDMITTPHAAFARYDAARAPVKTWIMDPAGDHDSPKDFIRQSIWSTMLGKHDLTENEDLESINQIFKEVDRVGQLDWTFAEYPALSRIWNQVESLQSTLPKKLPSLPYLLRENHIEASGEITYVKPKAYSKGSFYDISKQLSYSISSSPRVPMLGGRGLY